MQVTSLVNVISLCVTIKQLVSKHVIGIIVYFIGMIRGKSFPQMDDQCCVTVLIIRDPHADPLALVK